MLQAIIDNTYLMDILHTVSQGLLGPTMVLIIAMMAVSLFFVGQVIVEFFTERIHHKQNKPQIVNEINDAPAQQLDGIVSRSKLLRYQKQALTTVANNMGLPEEMLFALAQMMIADVERLYQRRLAWTDTISKIAPLLGLMGTLIPLGPGIVALGQNDPLQLSQSLLVAFDATVCGLVCAIVALVISKVRTGWYNDYLSTLESLMSCILDKAQQARKDGVRLPVAADDGLRESLGRHAQENAAAGRR